MAGKKPVLSAIEQRLFTLGLSKPSIEVVTSNIDSRGGLNDAWSDVLSNLISLIDSANDDRTKSTRPQGQLWGERVVVGP